MFILINPGGCKTHKKTLTERSRHATTPLKRKKQLRSRKQWVSSYRLYLGNVTFCKSLVLSWLHMTCSCTKTAYKIIIISHVVGDKSGLSNCCYGTKLVPAHTFWWQGHDFGTKTSIDVDNGVCICLTWW